MVFSSRILLDIVSSFESYLLLGNPRKGNISLRDMFLRFSFKVVQRLIEAVKNKLSWNFTEVFCT